MGPGPPTQQPQQPYQNPYQPIHPAPYNAPQHYPPGPPPLAEIIRRECAQCGTYIKEGEKSWELVEGIEGRSPNGMNRTLDPPGARSVIEAVHDSCLLEWAATQKEDEWNDYIWDMANELAVEMLNEEAQDPDKALDRRLEDRDS
jgi:hypothetical protein